MLTLKALIQMTPSDIRARAQQQCSVRIVKSIIDTDSTGEFKNVLSQVRATDGNRDAVIRFYDITKANLSQSPVWVHCSCPYFMFYLEVALTARSSSSILNSNGAYPRIRNPNLRPYLCKHLISLAPIAMKVPAKRVKPANVTNKDIQDVLRDLRNIIPNRS